MEFGNFRDNRSLKQYLRIKEEQEELSKDIRKKRKQQQEKERWARYQQYLTTVLADKMMASGASGFVPLLDTYPNAAAAYSVRRLSSTYTGALIEVRRSSDNAVQDIGYDSNGDLDTTALLSFVGESGTDNGFVRTWYDQSGNSNDAQQTTTSNQPQVVSNGSVLKISNKSILNFDGLNDGLNVNKIFNLQNISTFFTFSANNNQDCVLFDISQNLTNTLSFGLGNLGTNDAYGTRYIVSNNIYSKGQIGVNGHKLASHFGQQATPNIDLYLNNTEASGNQQSRSYPAQKLTIGFRNDGLNASNVKIQEFIIYESNQISNRTGIESNINTYFNIYS